VRSLRPGNVHSIEDWDEVLLPEIERQQELEKQVVFCADAAFAKPEIYEAMEGAGSEICDSTPGERQCAHRYRFVSISRHRVRIAVPTALLNGSSQARL
jgi:hypothetical protein